MLSYREYHDQSRSIGDIDPSYQMLLYLCERFELTLEQRFWLAFLYSTCYCGPTVFYIYNEFPDFENVDVDRLQRWWDKNKSKCLFQTDRMRVKTGNHFVHMFQSYREWCAGLTQQSRWAIFRQANPYVTYQAAYDSASEIWQMGRFSLFLYLEAVHVVTGFPMKPESMPMREAESCRNGLALALGLDELNTHGTDRRLTKDQMQFLQMAFDNMVQQMTFEDQANDVWNIETTLCAYKKYRYGKRYIGFYLDRQCEEIRKMQLAVQDGVDWMVLWQYRAETYDPRFLEEMK